MFKIRIGKLYVETIQLNTLTDETELRFTADFHEAKEFKVCDYFYLDIIKLLLEIDIDNIEKLVVYGSEESVDIED